MEMNNQDVLVASGRDVLPFLARTYQQLFLVPGEEGAEQYRKIVQKGEDAEVKDLSHFHMNENDRLELVPTPVGEVMVVTLCERADFELFIQIMTNKCMPCEVPPTQGASTLDGLANWTKIHEHKKSWMAERRAAGELFPDWAEEFRRFTSNKQNYLDVLIVLSAGPYSHVPAAAFHMDEREWLDRSYVIRKYHECTHFFCRRKYPEQINAVWDEVVADAIGIIAAFGRFDPEMEEIFFGIHDQEYTGGRLENYVDEKKNLDALAAKIHGVIGRIAGLYETVQTSVWKDGSFDFTEFADRLEEKQSAWW